MREAPGGLCNKSLQLSLPTMRELVGEAWGSPNLGVTLIRSGPGEPNQRKVSFHELFAGAFRNRSLIRESCLFS